MSSGLEIVVTIAVLAVLGVLLSLAWTRVLRKVGIHEQRHPREDSDVQMHQAQRNGSAGFGP